MEWISDLAIFCLWCSSQDLHRLASDRGRSDASGDGSRGVRGRIEAGEVRVGIIGLGYVGLPLARAFCDRGIAVLGFDTDPAKVEQLRRGESYIKHIPPEVVRAMQQAGFEATADFARLDEPDAIIICVPTPLTEAREPDLTYVVNSARAIAERLRPGQLVVLESTTYPGTTRDVVLPMLEASGLVPGDDFFLAFSPEREDPGNPDFSAADIPRSSAASTRQPASSPPPSTPRSSSGSSPVSSLEVAEACKILENTYRAVNIALVNELKVLYDRMGIDVWEVIEAAKTKPFGFQAFYPGPGLGGHCLARFGDGPRCAGRPVRRGLDARGPLRAVPRRGSGRPNRRCRGARSHGLGDALDRSARQALTSWKPVSLLFRRPFQGPCRHPAGGQSHAAGRRTVIPC